MFLSFARKQNDGIDDFDDTDDVEGGHRLSRHGYDNRSYDTHEDVGPASLYQQNLGSAWQSTKDGKNARTKDGSNLPTVHQESPAESSSYISESTQF